jgi:hypothetical protein
MRSKDYDYIATIIRVQVHRGVRNGYDLTLVDEIANGLASYFERDNPALFDRTKFLASCAAEEP